jgi:hypothetical protein
VPAVARQGHDFADARVAICPHEQGVTVAGELAESHYQATVRLGIGLALAAIMGAPVWVADAQLRAQLDGGRLEAPGIVRPCPRTTSTNG